jgi:hypothetical protein
MLFSYRSPTFHLSPLTIQEEEGMRRSLLIILAILLFVASHTAWSQSEKTNALAVGFNLHQYQRDFGLGLNFTSPYSSGGLAGRFEANLQWLEHYPTSADSPTWSSYFNIKAGFVSRNFVVDDKLAVYGEGGVIVLFPSSTFSSHSTQFGGYGVFGFEFRPTHFVGQYLELGGLGTGAKADKSSGKPVYSNGFMISTGIRFSL